MPRPHNTKVINVHPPTPARRAEGWHPPRQTMTPPQAETHNNGWIVCESQGFVIDLRMQAIELAPIPTLLI